MLAAACLGQVAVRAQEAEPRGKGRPREQDDPRARQEYLEQRRGPAPAGQSAGRLRRQALAERERMVTEQGERYRAKAQRLQTASVASRTGESMAGGPPGVWIAIGPQASRANFGGGQYVFSSGRVSAIAIDPIDQDRVYVGGAQGGVWCSDDAGQTFVPIGDTLPSLASGALAVDATGILWVGTGEQNFSQDSYYGAGIYGMDARPAACNAGFNWVPKNGSSGAFDGSLGKAGSNPSIGALVFQPGSNTIAAAAVKNNPNDSGVYVTFNATNPNSTITWTKSLGIIGTPTSLGFASDNGNILYAGISGGGVLKSVNGGLNFADANGGGSLTVGGTGRVSLAVFNSQIIYAAVTAEPSGTLAGLYKTTNGGGTWTRLNATPDFCGGGAAQCWYDLAIAVSPVDSNVVFVGGNGGANYLQRTANGGISWSDASGNPAPHPDFHALVFTRDGTRLYGGHDGGVSETINIISSPVLWYDLNATLNLAQFYQYLDIKPSNVNLSIGGTQDNGTQVYDGTLLDPLGWDAVTCGDGAGGVFDASANTAWANCQNTDVRRNLNGPTLTGWNSADGGIADSPLFIPPLIGDPQQSNRLYFGGQRLWKTDTGTGPWISSATLLTGASGEAIAAIAIAPRDHNNVVFGGTTDGSVYRLNPSNLAIPGTPLGSPNGTRSVNGLAGDPFDNTGVAVYAAVGGFGGGHVFRHDGVSWTNISGNLPDIPANEIVADPDLAGTLYLATDVGVYITANGGVTWNVLGVQLPNVAVFGLKLHRASRTLRAATHGRGMWDIYVPVASVNGKGGVAEPTAGMRFGRTQRGGSSNVMGGGFTNNGTVTVNPVNGQFLTLSGPDANQFTIFSTNCGGPVAPGASCSFSMVFQPSPGPIGTPGMKQATVNFATDAPSPYSPLQIPVSGFATAPPPNDDIGHATRVSLANYSDSLTTVDATTDPHDPLPTTAIGSGTPCVPAFGGSTDDTRNHTVWYAYTPSASSTNVSVDTLNSDYDTVLSVWDGTSLVGCNDDVSGQSSAPSQITGLSVTANRTYLIMVAGYYPSSSGVMQFHLSGPAPVGLTGPSMTITLSRPCRNCGGPGRAAKRAAETAVTAQISIAGLGGAVAPVSCSADNYACSLGSASIALVDGVTTLPLRLVPLSRALRLGTVATGPAMVTIRIGDHTETLTLPAAAR